MSDSRLIRLIARVKAITSGDWRGRAGKQFRKTTEAISQFTQSHNLTPERLADDAVRLGRTKLEGLANKEYSEVLHNFSETEKTKIEAETLRRSIDSRVRKEEAEARLSELQVLEKELELVTKMKEAGVTLLRDARGNMTLLPAPDGFNLATLAAPRSQNLLEDGSSRNPDS